ncbi:DUF1857-domain-containing protein [Clathrospora elynae]|uniref:DUF1857-domain-containing protein n=1 Tax=Clathrospora elynae TaxID=706981 RepID=A0A6A5SJG0_9PLEO|nr:DUF1857-domain-containing protein [Clathrospora elynae]
MVKLNAAYTSKINPAGATPVLTLAQVWAGLERKIRFPHEFIPVIESCTVLEDKDGVLTREVTFKEGVREKRTVKEICRGFWPAWVDFEQEDGTHIHNIIADGPSGGPEDMTLTFVFEVKMPHLEAGTEETDKEYQRLKSMGKMGVESSINAVREMVKDGRIKA